MTRTSSSRVFFRGAPRRVVEAVMADDAVEACATSGILEEYEETVDELCSRGVGRLDPRTLDAFEDALTVVDAATKVEVCRDPDDDKFIGCALDARALYVVSGDKDLLTLGSFDGVEMITAAEFCRRYLEEDGPALA